MNFENLKDITKDNVLPFYFINGGESFLTTSALSAIEKALGLSLPEFNKTVFPFDTTKTASDIVEACQSLPMVDDKRLVVVHDYVGKKNETERKIFEKYFKNPSLSTCLVFFSTNISDFFGSLEIGKNVGASIKCDKIPLEFLKKWTMQKVKENNFEISQAALDKLLNYCNFSITKVDTELRKFFSSGLTDKRITEKDIEENTVQDIEYALFDLTNAVSQRNKQKAFLLAEAMIKNKETNIISILSNHFRRLFFVLRSDYTKAELASLLNIKEFAVVKYREQAKFFGQIRLKEIYDKCLEVDFLVKSGGMDSKIAINYLIGWILN